MNNYCRNCGLKLEISTKICPKCGAEVFQNRINIVQKKKELDKYKIKEKIYIIIIILLVLIFPGVMQFTGLYYEYIFNVYICPLSFLVGVITLVYARITMNDSEIIRILFTIFITFIAIPLFLYVEASLLCSNYLY